MTTLAKYKEEKLSEIESISAEIIQTRLSVVEASQLADELKEETGLGLSNAYPEMALHYGKQRAVLRGLTQSELMYFDLPTVAEWSKNTSFTLPSRTKFGYIFVDRDGNDSKIFDPALYYLTRKKGEKTISTIEKDSDGFTYPTVLNAYSQQIVAVGNETTTYEIPLDFPIIPSSLKVYENDFKIGRDFGTGDLMPTQPHDDPFKSASIFYEEKVILSFKNPLEKGTVIKLVYDTYTGVDEFEKNYEQFDFSISQKEDFGQSLDLITLKNEVINMAPYLLDTMYLRRKSDHQQVGTIQVVCEGLRTNTNWDTKTGNPEDYLRITHDQFKTLLGYLDPDIINDLTKSANPEITSTGRESGGSYPDIEASPFFPTTDGVYTDSPPYTGNFVHSEEGVPKWSVHPDIKWQYGTAPASLGQTAQNNPATFLAALTAIGSFSGVENNPIPSDTGGASVAGYTYEMVGDYVYEFEWTEDLPDNPGTFVKGSGLEYSCHYNDTQHLKDDHLTHLQTQCGLISSLGDLSNTIDPGRQSGDATFISNTATFKSYLDSFLVYHDAFDPITSRPTYDTSETTALKAASTAYSPDLTARINDLDSVLGTATTSGYAKIIYDSCNMATHMGIGYLRNVIDELNSIQDLYTMILDLQNQYSLLP